MNNYYVYELIDPRSNLPFYVGKGTGNRCFVHTNYETLENTTNPYKMNTINKIKEQNLEVVINIVEDSLDENTAYAIEESLIKRYGRKIYEINGILTNICLEAKPPNFSNVTPEKQKEWANNISLGNIRAWSDGTRTVTEPMKQALEALHQYQKGENHPRYGSSYPSWCKGLSANTNESVKSGATKRTGQKRTPEQLENMRKAQKEAQNRPEVREKKSLALKGKPSGMLGKTHPRKGDKYV